MTDFDIGLFGKKWPDFHSIPQMEFRTFLKICSDAHHPHREDAIDMLLHPEDKDLPGYYLLLAAFIADSRIRVSEIPPELLQVFYELIAFAGKIPDSTRLAGFFKRILSNIPAELQPWLFDKRFPVRPFLDHLRINRVFSRRSCSSSILRNRFRILKRKILRESGTAESRNTAMEITLADLKYIDRIGTNPSTAVWRRSGACVLSPVRENLSPAPLSFPKVYWQAGGNRTLAYWKKLTDAQAWELTAIRSLAHAVSRRTGRVVLSWHNASLAAAGGWAFEDICSQFASQALYRDFVHGVFETRTRIRKTFDWRAAADIFEMRAKRIFAPKLAHAARELRSLAALPFSLGHPRESGEVASLPGIIDPAEGIAGKYEWSGALSPHQRLTTDRVREWYENERKTRAEGLVLMLALAAQGQRMLDSGSISSFVLPWIDKFFISSMRHADQGYLERIFKLVDRNIENPLVLFWEDTAHGQSPSLMPALEELAARGLPFRGIGVFDGTFDEKNSDRRQAEEIILADYPENRLFALRPLSDNHYTGTFRRILDGSDWAFFRFYDSSWKDNLVFIYSGTQVFPLLSVQTEMEPITPWVSDGHARYPFGSWFRRELRRRVLGPESTTQDPLSRAYASWANLL